MSDTTISTRYARALVDVIIEKREANEVLAELTTFSRMMNGHAQLRDLFASPVLALDRKRAVLGELLSRMKLRASSENFLRVLLANSRLHNLDQILRVSAKEIDRRTNIVSAEVTTARDIGEAEKALLRDKLKAATGKEVRLQFRTDPNLIGGVITRIGSTVYDGSIKTQLAQMKKALVVGSR